MKINGDASFSYICFGNNNIICLRLFLPIIMKSKNSKYHKFSETKLVSIINKKIISL